MQQSRWDWEKAGLSGFYCIKLVFCAYFQGLCHFLAEGVIEKEQVGGRKEKVFFTPHF